MVGPPSNQLPQIFVSNDAFSEALAKVGYTLPVSQIPVAPWALPVIIVGGDMSKFYTLYAGSGAALAAGTVVNMGAVPAGKQWKVWRVSLQAGTAGVRPAWLQNGAAASVGIMHSTVSSAVPNVWTSYPLPTDANPQLPLAILQAGDAVGVLGNENGLTAGYTAAWMIEETNAPTT